MNLAAFSINNSRITLFLLVMVCLLGITGYETLSRDSMPPFTVRIATVVSSFPGASPERVELLVSDKVEKVAQELPELKEVRSTSRTGVSVVQVELKDSVSPDELQPVWDRLRRKLETIDGLPSGVVPELNDDDVGVTYGIAVALVSDGFSYAEMKSYADDIRDELIKLDSASKVEINGQQDERIFVEINDARLAEYGLTATTLKNTLSSLNILESGGQINLGSERINLEPTGNFTSVADIENALIPVGSAQQMVFLGDIAEVSRGYIDPASQIVTVNGQKALTLHVSLIDNANIIKLGEEMDVLIKEWQAELPVGLDLKRIVSTDSYIQAKVSDFVINLLQSITIILVVMLVFLGLRTGLVIASLIPFVTLMTLMLMNMFKVGLNQVTLAALIMALGMMVDNAIVVAESVQVKLDKGVSKLKAAIDSCSELWASLLISTLTSSVAFLAFFLAQSTMGDIVGPIFVVITIALMSSWLMAMTVITLLCYYFLKQSDSQELSFIDRVIARLKVGYSSLILWALSHKVLIVLISVAMLAVSLYGFRYVAFVFFPDSDRNLVTVDINLPAGTRIESTAEVVEGISEHIKKELLVAPGEDGVVAWSAYVGEGPASYDIGYNADEPETSYAHMLVTTSSDSLNSGIVTELDKYTRVSFPQADILVSTLKSGGTGTPIEIKIFGEDPDVLTGIGEQVKLQLLAIPGTKNVSDDWGPRSKKVIVDVDQARAQNAGITSTDIAASLRTALDGYGTGEYREGDKTIPILLKSGEQQQSLQQLEGINIFAQHSGNSVPLLQVADIVPSWQYAKIKRIDLERTLVVSSELTATGNASDVMAALSPWLERESANWDKGYHYSSGGDAESTAESMGAVIAWLPLSGIIIVFLLVVQFNSYRKTSMVLVTIPLGLIGVTFGLLVFQKPFGFMPFLGLISLAGIVINNAIVLLDRIEFENTEVGRSIQDSIISACLQRFRPILLATFTTVLGLLPLYLSGGAMWEGMAISIMCGLMFGTLITLLLIPSMYSLLYRVDYSDYEFDEALIEE